METIVFLVIWLLIGIFQTIMRNKQKKQEPAPKSPPQRPRESQPSQPPATGDPEIEIPDFLKRLLGEPETVERPRPRPQPMQQQERPAQQMDAPRPVPRPRPVPPRPEAVQQPKSSEPVPTVEAAYERKGELAGKLAGHRKRKHPLQKMLKNRNSVRNAYVLKEVLDQPVGQKMLPTPYLFKR